MSRLAPSFGSPSKGSSSWRSVCCCRRGGGESWPALPGAVFAVLAVVKLLNLGFFYELDRPFNPIGDWASFGPAAGVLRDSAGELWTVVAVVGAILLVLFLLVFVTISAIHVTTLTARHRTASARTVGGARHRLGAVRGVRRPGRRRSKCRVGDNGPAG